MQEELFLQVRTFPDLRLRLVRLDGCVLVHNPGAAARCVEQHPVEAEVSEHLRELAAVVIGDYGIRDPHAVDVRDEGLDTRFPDLIRNERAGVLHQRGDVRRLAAGSRRHVEDPLALLRRERHAREERGCTLEDVMARHILRRGANGNLRLEHHEADLAPLADRIEIHPTIDQRRGEVAATGLETVRSNYCWSGRLRVSCVHISPNV